MNADSRLMAALASLPHRAPFRFVSDLRVLEAGVRGEGVWTVSGTEDFFAGHFPGDPIVPGVLLSEALAQLAGLVWGGPGHPRAVRLARVDVKFHAPVRPPGSISLAATLARAMDGMALFDVAANFGGSAAATGQIVLALAGEGSR